MEIKKVDWETILKENEAQRDQLLKNYQMALPQIEVTIKLIKGKIDEFILKEAKDEMPEDLKKVIKEVNK